MGSEYGIRTDQIFGEFGYRISFFEPFINFASVSLGEDRSVESEVDGEEKSTSLIDDANHVNAQFLTFGFRAEKELGSKLYGMLGFRKSLNRIDEDATPRIFQEERNRLLRLLLQFCRILGFLGVFYG